jgi:hypothetical protein
MKNRIDGKLDVLILILLYTSLNRKQVSHRWVAVTGGYLYGYKPGYNPVSKFY